MPVLSANMLQNVSTLAEINPSTEQGEALQVICAWPVSGQYGPGSRVLYYVLIAACVLARKAIWLRHAFLAAALILPATAALHGIALAAVHVPIDMDVYGAFQLCTMSVLAAPVTVSLSRTYSDIRGRNAMFIWAVIILAGLLSLTIEFYRIQTHDCLEDNETAISLSPSAFLEQPASCSLNFTCDASPNGPRSPMRRGSNDDIYLIPAPDKLTFGTATLISAALCIHTALWLVTMVDRIFEVDIRGRIGMDTANDQAVIEGTDRATPRLMRRVNNTALFNLSIAVIPIFGGAGLALLILGEMNFFSAQVKYQTEPMASAGQWGGIVSTILATLGSLYLLLAGDVETVKKEANGEGKPEMHRVSSLPSASLYRDSRSPYGGVIEDRPEQPGPSTPQGVEVDHIRRDTRATGGMEDLERTSSNETLPTVATVPSQSDLGNRRRVANTLIRIGEILGDAAHNYKENATDADLKGTYPTIPGEGLRNGDLDEIERRFKIPRDESASVTPALSRSRASSFNGRPPSIQNVGSSSSAAVAQTHNGRQRSSTLPVGRVSVESPGPTPLIPPSMDRGRWTRPRSTRDTLEVPSQTISLRGPSQPP